MAIEKNSVKVARVDGEFSSGSRDSVSIDDDELRLRSLAMESDEEEDEFDDVDSGAGSDDFDLLELGEIGAEFCQVGDQTCNIPFELYDLSDLGEVLSLDVWNEVLGEEDRFGLTKYLPDMDQESYVRTMKELFTGCNFHFGNPVTKLFDMLKGGLCEPRVALYRQGMNYFQQHQHYHVLRKYQNSMVNSLLQTRDAWLKCRGYSIDERLRVLNIVRNQKCLMHEKMEGETESSGSEESNEGCLRKKSKDLKLGQKMGQHSLHAGTRGVEFPSRGRLAMDPEEHGKQNPKGTLKLAGSKTPSSQEIVARSPSVHQGLEIKSEAYSSPLLPPRQNKSAAHELVAAVRARDQIRSDADADEAAFQKDQNVLRGSALDKTGVIKLGKKNELVKSDEFTNDGFNGLHLSSKNGSHAYGRNRNVNQLDIKLLTERPTNKKVSHDVVSKRPKYSENLQQSAIQDQRMFAKGHAPRLSLKGNRGDLLDRAEPFWHDKAREEAFSMDQSSKYDDWSVKSKKWKASKGSPDLKPSSYRNLAAQMDDRVMHSGYRAKSSQEKFRGNSKQNGGLDMGGLRSSRMFIKSDETESESSEQDDEDDEDDNHLMSSLGYSPGVFEDLRSFPKSGLDPRKASFGRKDRRQSGSALDGIPYSSKKMVDFGEQIRKPVSKDNALKAKPKGKMREASHMHNLGFGVPNNEEDESDFERKPTFKMGKSGLVLGEADERLSTYLSRAHPVIDRRQKGEGGHDFSMSQSSHLRDYDIDEEHDSIETHRMVGDNGLARRLGRKGQKGGEHVNDGNEISGVPLVGCNLVNKKRKGKADMTLVDGRGEFDKLNSSPLRRIDDYSSSKKRGKRKLDADSVTLAMGTSEPPVTEVGATDMELDTKPQKKPFILITPTVHTGFSFSIVHLLTAVRMAMITPLTEEAGYDVGKLLEKNEGQKLTDEQNGKTELINGVHFEANTDVNNTDSSGQSNVPSLTVQEIVNRVRSNPGDPSILETQEPLQDLVRGVLKIFSSKSAPLGAKGWKPLILYEKPKKSWSWIGPVSHSSSDHETPEEETSPEAWGLPQKMLVKLVDAFANWLKSGQETLQQIGSLPAPPVNLMQFNKDEKERFRDLRAQRSLNTINPSVEEVRAYFRREEVLRYSVPDRAFSYTAADGKKSIVAPLRRCGGKPTSKAREHFMLKRERPPHVTILCLVRDAAARLPGSIGTRADVCTLIRDSQYIVEDVSDAQVNQVVSGALDRLHYERDPCVQYDGERKLWVYLHRDREEEDFEDDGTSSTKKWKRQKKDAGEQFEEGAVNVAYFGGEQNPGGSTSGFDLTSDLNVEPPFMNDDDKGVELLYNDGQGSVHVEKVVEVGHGSEQGAMHQSHPMGWEPIGLNSMRDNKLLCQENSTNEDFDDETFGRDRPVGLLSASLL